MITPVLLPQVGFFFFFLRLIGVKISLAVEQICKMFLSGES